MFVFQSTHTHKHTHRILHPVILHSPNILAATFHQPHMHKIQLAPQSALAVAAHHLPPNTLLMSRGLTDVALKLLAAEEAPTTPDCRPYVLRTRCIHASSSAPGLRGVYASSMALSKARVASLRTVGLAAAMMGDAGARA